MRKAHYVFLSLANSEAERDTAWPLSSDRERLAAMQSWPPDFMSAQHFAADPDNQRPGTTMSWRYLSVYHVYTDEPTRIFSSFEQALARGASPPWQTDGPRWLFIALGERQINPKPVSGSPYLVLAWTNALEGQGAPFRRWYAEVHVPEVLAYLPHFISARRFQLSAFQPGHRAPEWEYLTIYEVVSADIAATHALTPVISRQFFSPRESLAPGYATWTWSPLSPEYRLA